jgi:hypothetical protein
MSREWTSDDSKAKMWLRYSLNTCKFKLTQYLVSDGKLMEYVLSFQTLFMQINF